MPIFTFEKGISTISFLLDRKMKPGVRGGAREGGGS